RTPARLRTRPPVAVDAPATGPRVLVRIDGERADLVDERCAPSGGERGRGTDELERPLVVVEAEEERAEQGTLRRRGLVQPVPREDDVGGPLVLDLEHRALVRRVRAAQRLDDDAVEPCPLELGEPPDRDVVLARAGGEEDRRTVEPEPAQAL